MSLLSRRHFLSTASATALAGILTACGSGTGAQKASADAAGGMVIGLTYTPNIQFAPFYLALSSGQYSSGVSLRHHGDQEGQFDALLAGKSKRALHILTQLRLEACEPVILLRTVQRELLLLVTLKRQMTQMPLRALFDKHRVWQNRRGATTEALNRLSADQLRQAVHLLSRIELIVKQDYGQSVWAELEGLSLLLCHKALADIFIDG